MARMKRRRQEQQQEHDTPTNLFENEGRDGRDTISTMSMTRAVVVVVAAAEALTTTAMTRIPMTTTMGISRGG